MKLKLTSEGKRRLMIKVFLILTLALKITAQAQLAVIVSPPQVTGDKTIVPLEMKNNFNQGVASARAAVLLLDEQGRMVGQSAKWVIGSSQAPTESKPGLASGGTNTFNFVVTATKPFTSTNLTAKVVFNHLKRWAVHA